MQITVNEQDIIKAAGEGMDAFLMLFHDRIMEAIGGRLDAETMPLLNGEQITLLAYVALRDFAEVRYDGVVTKEVAAAALDLLDVDSMGLDRNDRRILETIIRNFSGGPVGLETLAATIGEDSGTIEDVIEPYLVMNGLIMRTPKGRVATDLAFEHFERKRA